MNDFILCYIKIDWCRMLVCNTFSLSSVFHQLFKLGYMCLHPPEPDLHSGPPGVGGGYQRQRNIQSSTDIQSSKWTTRSWLIHRCLQSTWQLAPDLHLEAEGRGWEYLPCKVRLWASFSMPPLVAGLCSVIVGPPRAAAKPEVSKGTMVRCVRALRLQCMIPNSTETSDNT